MCIQRILHARTAIAEGDGQRHVQGCYLNRDGVRLNLERLRRQAPTWSRIRGAGKADFGVTFSDGVKADYSLERFAGEVSAGRCSSTPQEDDSDNTVVNCSAVVLQSENFHFEWLRERCQTAEDCVDEETLQQKRNPHEFVAPVVTSATVKEDAMYVA